MLVNAGSSREILGDFPDGAVLPIQGPRVRSLVRELDLGVGVGVGVYVWGVCVGVGVGVCGCVCRGTRSGVCVCVCDSVVSDSATPWTVAHQAPLSMEFSRPEFWSG